MSDINKFTTKEVLNKVLLDSSGNAVNAFSHTTQEALNAALDDDNSRLNVNLVGGTIGGDVTINGDLTVNGDGAGAYDEIVNGELHVKITETNAFLVEKADGTDVFIVDTTNLRVGIGVVPTHNLNIYNGSGSSGMTVGKYASGKTVALLGTSADTSGYFQIQSYASQGSTFGNIALNAQGGNVGIGTNSPDHILCIEDTEPTFRIFDAANTLNQEQTISFGTEPGNRTHAEISGVNKNTGNASGDLSFKTNNGSALAERMRIDSSGNVGIGIASPLQKLHVSGHALLGVDTGANIYFTDADGTADEMMIGYDKANTRIRFRSNAHSADRMVVTKTGNVGIGVDAPSSKLHVRETAGDEFFTFANGNGIGLVNNVASHGIGISASQSGSYGGQGSSALIVTEGGGSANAGTVQLVHDGTIGFTYKGGNVGIGRSTNIDKKLHILSSTSGDGITLEQSSVGANAIRFEANSSSLRGLFGSEDSDGGALLSGSSGYSMVLRSESDIFLATNGSNEALKIDTSQNATFAGNINMTADKFLNVGGAVSKNNNIGSTAGGITIQDANVATLSLWDTTNAGYHSHFYQVEGNSGIRSSGSLTIQTNAGTTALTIDSSQNATFAGSIIVPDNNGITSGTSDGSDNKSVVISGGGAQGYSRGAYINLAGNEDSSSGRALLSSGGSASTYGTLEIVSGEIKLEVGGNDRMVIDTNSRISLSNNNVSGATNNTVFGKLAGDDLESGGIQNSLFGENAGHALRTGDENALLGMDSGALLQNGSRNVAIGKSSANSHATFSDCVVIGQSAEVSANSASNQIVIGRSATGVADNSVSLGNTDVTKLYIAPNSTDQQITFRENNQDQGIIRYLHSTEQMKFYVGGAEHTRLGSGGDLILLHGGINFLDAEASSASSDVNTLDDYEEGDYDATMTCSISGTITLEGAYNNLAYVKVGRSVTVTGLLIVNAVSSPSGYIKISLPFAIGDGTDVSKSFSGAVHIHNANSILSRDFVNIGVEGESFVRVYVGDASGLSSDSAEGVVASTQSYIGITYQV